MAGAAYGDQRDFVVTIAALDPRAGAGGGAFIPGRARQHGRGRLQVLESNSRRIELSPKDGSLRIALKIDNVAAQARVISQNVPG